MSVEEMLGINAQELMSRLKQGKEAYRDTHIDQYKKLSPKQKEQNIRRVVTELCHHYYTNDGHIEQEKLDEIVEILSHMIGWSNHPQKIKYLSRGKDKKIVFLGATGKGHMSRDELKRICVEYGIGAPMIEFRDDYDKLTNMNIDNLKNNKRILGIIIGAIPHSVKGTDGSLLSYIENNASEFPPYVVCRKSGDLGFTTREVRSAIPKFIKSDSP